MLGLDTGVVFERQFEILSYEFWLSDACRMGEARCNVVDMAT